jgi:hypothetical protein
VVIDGEPRRLEALDVVAGLALPLVGARSELSRVRVGVAVGAEIVSQLPELARMARVTLVAGDGCVAAAQRETRSIVIESHAFTLNAHPLPSGGDVTGAAFVSEGSVMRVRVAAGAIGERSEAAVTLERAGLRLFRDVAFLAEDRCMFPGEGRGGF